MKRTWILLLVVVVLGIGLFFLGTSPNESLQKVKQLPIVRNILPQGILGTADNANLLSDASNSTGESAPLPPPSAEFTQWYEAESSNVENSVSSPKEKAQELRNKAQQLTPAEVQYLARLSLQKEAAANKKIFAVYLLSLAPQNTQAGLVTIIQAPLEYAGQHEVHSTEETLSMQETTLRRMAFDALLEQTKGNPMLRDRLKEIVSQMKDASLRDYAERSLEATE